MLKRNMIAAAMGLLLGLGPVLGQGNPALERLRMRENVLTLRLLRLTQALNLSEDQAAKIYPKFNEIERRKLEIQKEMTLDLVELRQLLRSENPAEGGLAGRLERIKGAQASIRSLDGELEDFVENNLTTVQKAKYLIFTIDFYRGLADAVGRTGGARRGPMSPIPLKK